MQLRREREGGVTYGRVTMRNWTRREVLTAGAAVAAVSFVGAACSSDDDAATTEPDSTDAPGTTTATSATATEATGTSEPQSSSDATALTAADFDGLGTCSLTPEQTAGPFPLDQQFDRRDITEGKAGHPLRLGFRVVDEECAPVAGAAVEVWHTDATGDYSAFADGGSGKDEGEGTTFLRGTQTAGDDGIVEFATIYPGWYGGRAVHIHLRVHVDDASVLTSQVYFDEGYTEDVFATGAYAEFGPPDTTWATDGIAGDPAADGTALTVAPAGTGTLALLNLGIPA